MGGFSGFALAFLVDLLAALAITPSFSLHRDFGNEESMRHYYLYYADSCQAKKPGEERLFVVIHKGLIGFRSKLRFDSLAPHGFALHALLCEAEYVCNHLVDDVLAAEIIVAVSERR